MLYDRHDRGATDLVCVRDLVHCTLLAARSIRKTDHYYYRYRVIITVIVVGSLVLTTHHIRKCIVQTIVVELT